MVGETALAAIINFLKRKEEESSVDIIRYEVVKATHADVTGARAIDGTIYQNTGSRPLVCMVSTAHEIVDLNDNSMVVFYVQDVTPPVLWLTRSFLFTAAAYVGGAMGISCCTTFFVPPGWYYRAVPTRIGGGDVDLDRWIEVEL